MTVPVTELHKPRQSSQKKRDDQHSRLLARKDLAAMHRNDLSLSDLAIIGRLTGNADLERLVREAST